MSLYFLIIFIAVILVIIEMSTLVLESTGLQKTVARFQAISLLTGTGYTTSEAELITKHPIRRKVAEFLILFGNVAFAIIIAVFLNFLNNEFIISELLAGILVISALFLLFRFRSIQKLMVSKMRSRLSHISTLDEIFHLSEHDIVLEVELTSQHKHLFKGLAELNLATKYGIHILTIARRKVTGDVEHIELLKYPSGSAYLQAGDKITMFGDKGHIQQIFGYKG